MTSEQCREKDHLVVTTFVGALSMVRAQNIEVQCSHSYMCTDTTKWLTNKRKLFKFAYIFSSCCFCCNMRLFIMHLFFIGTLWRVCANLILSGVPDCVCVFPFCIAYGSCTVLPWLTHIVHVALHFE